MTDIASTAVPLIEDATAASFAPSLATSPSHLPQHAPIIPYKPNAAGTTGMGDPSGHDPPDGQSQVRKRMKLHHIPSAYHSVIAGAGAGLVSSVATCPLDVIKTRLQAQLTKSGSSEYEGVSRTVARILRQSGIKGMYRGLGPTIMGYLPTWGIYFSVYDEVKQRLGAGKQDLRSG